MDVVYAKKCSLLRTSSGNDHMFLSLVPKTSKSGDNSWLKSVFKDLSGKYASSRGRFTRSKTSGGREFNPVLRSFMKFLMRANGIFESAKLKLEVGATFEFKYEKKSSLWW